jgi:alkaline phosphatase
VAASGQPQVLRLTPPSNLFRGGEANPIVSRFLPLQRFDLQATVAPEAGRTITAVTFLVNGQPVGGTVSMTPATVGGLPANTMVVSRRAFSVSAPGVYNLQVVAQQDNGAQVTATGNFEVAPISQLGRRAKNVIVLIGDGMGIAHRTAARIMSKGVSQGKSRGKLAMDTMPVTGILQTHSLNSIVTDSSPGAACYSTGNKSNNNQHGVFPDDTTANFDNPRVELMGEYLFRFYGKTMGIVTTSDVFDATPGSFGSHTQSRGAGTGIVDQFFDDRNLTGLRVLLGGGRKWYIPSTTPGSARGNSTDYTLPPDVVAGWGAAPGALDPNRDLIGDHVADGWFYAPTRTEMLNAPKGATKLLGLFSLSNMNVALDKINGRRGATTVVNDFGFPDQPMLDEMTAAALRVLNTNPNGFSLMVEAASIDKQAHNMDTERWILDTIEFDRAVQVCLDFAAANPDTLVIVTADHECAGINIIGGSRVTDAALVDRIGTGLGEAQVRNGVVGTYEAAGFPRYVMAVDGYPVTTDVDFRMLIGYAANADRFEDWRTNPLPLRDSQQPFNNVPPLSLYPSGPLNRDVAGNFRVTGQIADPVAAHTASDIPVYAAGRGAQLFTGTMDNTDVFFRAMQSVLGGSR